MRLRIGLVVASITMIALAACYQSYQNIPPNFIAMELTPTGYEDTIYTPGQIDIGTTSTAGQGNQLVLIQSSGGEVKEQILERDPAKPSDPSDHRCMTADQNPMTLDVRLVLALPDWTTPAGKKDMKRLFSLANPTPMEGNSRIQSISAQSVYEQQAQLQVRGMIRQICAGYADFAAAFKAFGQHGPVDLTSKIQNGVAQVLIEQGVPLRLVAAQVSNMKPDESVVQAQLAQKAAQARIAAIKTLTDFLDQDPTGTRKMVYRMQVLQELVHTANANGHNTIYMTDFGDQPGNGPKVVPLPLAPK